MLCHTSAATGTFAQLLAISVFLLTLTAIVVGKIHRYVSALIGAVLMVGVLLTTDRGLDSVLSILNLEEPTRLVFWFPQAVVGESHGINWQVIIFVAGMMIMVEGLAAAGFLRWLSLTVAKLVHYKTSFILIAFILVSGFLSMIIDSITVLIFLSAVTVELAKLMKFDPIPIVISEIFAANIEGAATMCGDPPNLIIGTSLGYTFMDFALNTGPIALAAMALSLTLMYLLFRRTLDSDLDRGSMLPRIPKPREAIINPRLFVANTAILIIVAILLATHAETHLSVATIGCIASTLTLMAEGRGAAQILKRLDWRTLLFFFGLFICVGGLEEMSILKILADYIERASSGNLLTGLSLVLWLSASVSAVVDNIPFTAVMVPVVKHMSLASGVSLHVLAWALALGAVIGGNATPIGASANVVAAAISEKQGYPIGENSAGTDCL